MDSDQSSKFLTIAETCRRLKIARSTFYILYHAGEIPLYGLRGARRVKIADVEAFEAKLPRVPPKSDIG